MIRDGRAKRARPFVFVQKFCGSVGDYPFREKKVGNH